MATREGAIRVTLRDGAFTSQMRRTTSEVEREGKRMGRALSAPLSAGMSSVKKSITGMFSSLNSKLKGTLQLGASLATGVMIKRALDLQGIYRNISFTLAKLPGVSMSWEQVQQMINKAADETGQKSESIAAAFDHVVTATGNLSYSKDSLSAIGTAATASGKDIGSIATAAQMMNRKFGIANDEVNDGLTAFMQLTDSGGKSLDELTGKFGMMAGEARSAGMKGVKGLSQLLGIMLQLDSPMGEKADSGLKMLFQTLKTGSSQLRTLQKDAMIKFDADSSAIEKLRELLKTQKGIKAAQKAFTGDARQAFDTLTQPFEDTFKAAREKGMSQSDAVNAGLLAFDSALNKASNVTWKWSDVQKMAADRMKDDPSVKLRQAMEKIERAFARPEMIRAIDEIAKHLPALAEKLAGLIKWITEHPGGAIAAGVGMNLGGSAIGGAASAGAGSLVKKIGEKIASVGASAAAGAAGAAGTAMAAGGEIAGATGAGATAAAGAGAIGAALTGIALLGSAIIGGLEGYALHKTVFDPKNKAQNKKVADALQFTNAAFNVTHSGSAEEKMAVIQDVKNARANLGKGKYTTEYMMGSLAAVFNDIESPAERLARTNQELLQAQIQLLESIQKQKSAQSDSTDQVEKFTRELGQAGDTLRTVIPRGGASRGVNHMPNKPGSEPVRG